MSPTTDTSEGGLEAVIVSQMVEGGWVEGDPADYEREFAVDLAQLRAFLEEAQPDVAEAAELGADGPVRRKFLSRLQGEIAKRGVVDVLRDGIHHGPFHVELFYGSPSPGNASAAERFAMNRFTVTRQLRYSREETGLALDFVIFLNGLPVATFELKNSLTKQTVEDAVEQYKRDRDPRELLFEFGRCLAHFAVDDSEVRFCTELKGKRSWFLPFNRGYNDGAGNPPNPDGLKTDYLWRRTLSPAGLTEIIEDYAQVLTFKDDSGKKRSRVQIFPRYHQLDVVQKLLADAGERGSGHRYLIQHSAGSGKSNSIAWLAHQLIGLEREGKPIFDSVVVVTDRRVLDRQITATIRQFAQVGATVGHADRSGDLKRFLADGKKIIISTVQKFPVIVEEIGDDHRGSSFAVIIDEAHSSQGGKTSSAVNAALGEAGKEGEEESPEDRVNRVMEARKMLPNASYFAFTATPKNKTLEIFGDAMEPSGPDADVRHRPFHTYSMKQAIEENFIVDVLSSYTPIDSYYKLRRAIEEDKMFDAKRASKKLRRFVEGNRHAIDLKAEIMVDHFHSEVLAPRKIGGRARAMVVCAGVDRAIDYFHAIEAHLRKRKSPFRAIVAFSGEREHDGEPASEASLNKFPASAIEERFKEDPYRFLVCADKFQTGYDEPLLHTMYVDKPLAGVQAVQTLSRLNRAHPAKHDAFVLDFANDIDTIEKAFSAYYRTTLLARETDPDKLHDLRRSLYSAGVFEEHHVRTVVDGVLSGVDRPALDPPLDACVATYKEELDEDAQVEFKANAKAFSRTYGFLASILPYSIPEWEELSIFCDFLIPKLPAPREDDLSRGILETIDMDSYRAEKRETLKIALEDSDSEIEPVPSDGKGFKPEVEMQWLSDIIKAFNEQFGNIEWEDRDRIQRRITVELPAKVSADGPFQNARENGDAENVRIEFEAALGRAMSGMLQDETELYKLYVDNPSFERWLSDTVFAQVNR